MVHEMFVEKMEKLAVQGMNDYVEILSDDSVDESTDEDEEEVEENEVEEVKVELPNDKREALDPDVLLSAIKPYEEFEDLYKHVNIVYLRNEVKVYDIDHLLDRYGYGPEVKAQLYMLYERALKEEDELDTLNDKTYDTSQVISIIQTMQAGNMTDRLSLTVPKIRYGRLNRLSKECNVDMQAILQKLNEKEMEAISYWTADELRENMKYLFSQLEVVINSLLKTTASPQFTTIRRHFEQTSGR